MDRENLNQQLLEAVKQGDTGRMWELVEQGADINARGKWGWTALMWLAKKGHLTPELPGDRECVRKTLNSSPTAFAPSERRSACHAERLYSHTVRGPGEGELPAVF